MIAIIDYGMGNLRSVEKAFLSMNYPAVITSDPEVVLNADRAILPGVGAFADCFDGLLNSGLHDATLAFIASGRPFMGICVGMQMLFEKSYEFGIHEGLGHFSGVVRKFPDEIVAEGMKIPHMGWNTVKKCIDHPLLDGIEDNAYFYFVHSYYVDTPDTSIVAASCEYGVPFTAMAVRGNVAATQFHPEKSQKNGITLLRNFAEWTPLPAEAAE